MKNHYTRILGKTTATVVAKLKQVKLIGITLVLIFFGSLGVKGQTTVTFTTTGSNTWVCPAGVNTATVQCWGAGGGGGSNVATAGKCGGGGGGAYSSTTINVTAGTTYYINVGSGAAAANGNPSWFNASTTNPYNSTNSAPTSMATGILAAGGTGVTTAGSATGGAGGTTAASYGSTKWAGGTGGTGSSYSGSGGGGAGSTVGGSVGNGNTGVGGAGGTSSGGAGGLGKNSNGGGGNGSTYGGGGGGAYRATSGNNTGGNGAQGYVTVTFTCTAMSTFPWSESFDGVTFVPTACWSNTQVSGTGLWTRVTAGYYPVIATHSGAGMARFNSYSNGSGTEALLVTPPLNLSSAALFTFWMYRDAGYTSSADLVNVYYNSSPTKTGATSLGTINRSYTLSPVVGSVGWYQYTFTVPASSNVYVILDGLSANGNDIYLDDINITASTPPTITSLGATSGCVGSSLTINGTNFTGAVASGVTIGGTAVSSITSNTGTQLIVVVGSGTTGIVSVTAPGGTATSGATTFTVNQLPATPGNPTSNSPQCVTSGVTLTASGTPPGGETWYWQSSASGTSTTSSGSTYNVTTTGTYYIRSQNNITSCWSSGAGSLAVTVIPTLTPATTPSPADASSGVCYAGGGVVNSVSWAAVTNAVSYDVYFGAGSLPGTVTSNVATNSYTCGTLLPSTTYYWKVVAKNLCGDVVGSSTWTFSTASSPCPLIYCTSSATTTADEEISNVTFGSLNNSSICTTLAPGPGSVVSMYSNYTSGVGAPAAPVATLGSSVPFSVTMTTCGGNYGNSFDIYIDYNQNGVFTDPGELVYDGASFTGNHTDVGNITIPVTATEGTTRMRVVCVEGGATSSCGTYSWGETEDYNVNIVSANPPTISSLGSTSGCVGSTLTINGTYLASVTAVTIGGTPATILNATSTVLTVTIGSGTTGTVNVVNPYGNATSIQTFTINTPPTAPGAITSNSPQCAGTGVTFTQGSCSATNCYWVSSALGTETSNSSSSFTTATTAGTYNVWVRAFDGNCWSPAVTANGVINVIPSAVTITTTPSSSTICSGDVATLTASGETIGSSGSAFIGTGITAPSSTSWPNPLSAWFGGTKHQMLFTVSELNAIGLTAGSSITSIGFNIATANAVGVCNDFTIRLGTTALTSLTGFVSGTTTKYNGSYTPAVGIINFTLSSAFVWDGSSNLIVETVHNAGNSGNGSGTTTYATTTASNSSYYAYQDGVTPAGVASFDAYSYTNLAASTIRPNVNFGFTNSVPTAVTWTPITELYNEIGASTPYVAGTNKSTIYAKATSNRTYTATATASGTGCTNSGTAAITVRPTPTASISGTTEVCLGGSSPLVTFTNPQTIPVTITYNVNGINQTTINVGASTTNTLPAPTSVAGTFNYNLVSVSYQDAAPSCTNLISGTATITVDPTSAGGTVSSNQSICSGSSPANLTLSGNTGAVIRWESSPNVGFSSPTPIAVTSTTLTGATIGTLTSDTYFRAVVQSGTCASANSSSIKVTVNPNPTLSGASQAATVCAGTGATINLTGLLAGSTSTINYTINGVAQTAITGVVANGSGNASFTSANLIAANNGQILQITGVTVSSAVPNCSGTFAQNVTLSIDATTVGGTVASNQTICSGSTPADLTLTGNTGNVLRWEKAADAAFTTPTTIAGTSTTLLGTTIGALTSSTYFRAVVQSGVCTAANSAFVLVTVDPTTVGGAVSATQMICTGSTPADLTLTGNTGNVIRWEKSTDEFTWPTIIAVTSTTLSGATMGPINTSSYFRAVVQSGVCSSVNSAYATIAVNSTTVGGTVSSDQAICSGETPDNLTLSGNVGGVLRWEKSSDAAFTSPTTIAVVSLTLTGATIGSLSANTYFRAVVQNGACLVEYSSSILVTVHPNPTLTGASQAAAVCAGSPANITLAGLLPGSFSTIDYTIDGALQTPVANVLANGGGSASFASAVLTAANNGQILQITGVTITSTTPNCSGDFTQNVTLSVDPTSVGGTVSSNQTICSGNTPSNLTLSGNTGNVVRWEKAGDAAFTTPTTITGTSTTLLGTTIGVLTSSTYFRAVVKSGTCAEANSASILITVYPLPTATISGTTAVCQNAT
ncbi:MAG: GEVED domain-containing protein, partial [Bacteroidota bacterium]